MSRREEVRSKDETLANVLKQERALHGWSQEDVAARIGSNAKTVGRWERGITFPSPYMCQQLSSLYGRSVRELGLLKIDLVDAESHQERNMEKRVPGVNTLGGRKLLFLLCTLCAILILLLAISMGWRLYTGSQARAVALVPSNPYDASMRTLALNDPLTAGSAAGWSLDNNDEGQCFFADGAYRIRGIKNQYMKVCVAAETYFANFTYEVKMQIMAGDCGGLAFRMTFPQLYYFLICQDGNYRFVRYSKDNQADRRVMVAGTSAAIHRGFNNPNTLAVVADGDTFTLSINHTQVYHGTDGAYLDGQIGLLVHTCSIVYLGKDSPPDICAAPVEAVFSDAKIWR